MEETPLIYDSRLQNLTNLHQFSYNKISVVKSQPIQHQHRELSKMCNGFASYKLVFDHQVHLIYFWGFDKSKIKKIKFTLNGHTFYDGSVEALEHYKLSRGYDVEPMMLFFSQDDFNKPTKCTVNFSRIDYAQLIIESDQKEPTDVYIIGLNSQLIRFGSGMGNITFAN